MKYLARSIIKLIVYRKLRELRIDIRSKSFWDRGVWGKYTQPSTRNL